MRFTNLPSANEKKDTHDEEDEALRGEDGVDDHQIGAAPCDQGARPTEAKKTDELGRKDFSIFDVSLCHRNSYNAKPTDDEAPIS